MKILLGSNWPRRKELLQSLGFDFEVVSIDCDEVFPENLSVENIAGHLSELKADAYQNLQKDEVLLTSDTIVTFEGKVLGKPKNRKKAVEMLQHLSDVESYSIAYEYEKFSCNVANNFDRCIEMHREKMICDEFSDILDRGISGVERLLDLIYEQING